MICLFKKSLPETVNVLGKDYVIHTDFRFWLNFLVKAKKNELEIIDIISMFPLKAPSDLTQTVKELFNFAYPKKSLPRDILKNDSTIIFDYEIDADLIFAAFWENYHIDLLDEKTKLHFYKFLALFNGLHGTKLNDVMRIRSYDENDRSTYDQVQKQLKKAWEIIEEQKLTDYEKELLENFENSLK